MHGMWDDEVMVTEEERAAIVKKLDLGNRIIVDRSYLTRAEIRAHKFKSEKFSTRRDR